tara:strand:+ start:540 stop:1418 length:879 start_codon:yes stop_codon:yes gene_type:complete
MNIVTLSFLILTTSILLWQINIFTGQGVEVLETVVEYVSDTAKEGLKYSFTFIPNSHESKMDKLRKQKDSEDLKRRIRIENIENELKESNAVLEKGMPNYHKLLYMFGESTIGQYELASRIVMMNGTIFVSESLGTLSQTIKDKIGEELKNMNMKHVVDKMIQHNIYIEIQTSLYTQQFELVKNNQAQQYGMIVLEDTFDRYHNAWMMNIVNDLMKNVNSLENNLDLLDQDNVLYEIKDKVEITYKNVLNHDHRGYEYFLYNDVVDDEKCIKQKNEYKKIRWDEYNKYHIKQ